MSTNDGPGVASLDMTMLNCGTILGYIVLGARATIAYLHGPGGQLEGWPADWEMAFAQAVAHAADYIERKP